MAGALPRTTPQHHQDYHRRANKALRQEESPTLRQPGQLGAAHQSTCCAHLSAFSAHCACDLCTPVHMPCTPVWVLCIPGCVQGLPPSPGNSAFMTVSLKTSKMQKHPRLCILTAGFRQSSCWHPKLPPSATCPVQAAPATDALSHRQMYKPWLLSH